MFKVFKKTKLTLKGLKEIYSKQLLCNELLNKNVNLKIEGSLRVYNNERLHLGKNVILQEGVILHCGGADWCDGQGYIKIGDDSCISPYCIIYGAGAGVEIGKNFDCGPGTKIFSSSTDYKSHFQTKDINTHYFEKVIIDNNVICYSNVVIGPGVCIGHGAIIAANSVVTKNIPPNEFWGGIPARKI